MYSRYIKRVGLQIDLLEKKSNGKGARQITAKISGKTKLLSKLFNEGGAHRLQHKTASRKKDRIHTSTATVAVLPILKSSKVVINNEDIKTETMRGSGAGGQHRNKTDSMVRLTHLPTNITASIDGRSQAKNRVLALQLLKARLIADKAERKAGNHQQLRASQTAAERARAVRTYDLISNTVRGVSGKTGNAKKILSGRLDLIL